MPRMRKEIIDDSKLKPIKDLVNDTKNLTVTTTYVNNNKKLAIQNFLKDLKQSKDVEDGLAPYLKRSFEKAGEERLRWRIARNIHVAAQDIIYDLTKMDDHGSGHVLSFKENLESVIKNMKLTECC